MTTSTPRGERQTRTLGRTGIAVSAIGLGTEHLLNQLRNTALSERCPFDVPVIERMQRAADLFE